MYSRKKRLQGINVAFLVCLYFSCSFPFCVHLWMAMAAELGRVDLGFERRAFQRRNRDHDGLSSRA